MPATRLPGFLVLPEHVITADTEVQLGWTEDDINLAIPQQPTVDDLTMSRVLFDGCWFADQLPGLWVLGYFADLVTNRRQPSSQSTRPANPTSQLDHLTSQPANQPTKQPSQPTKQLTNQPPTTKRVAAG